MLIALVGLLSTALAVQLPLRTVADLIAIPACPSCDYVLMNDILNVGVLPNLGTFTGTLYGQDRKITGVIAACTLQGGEAYAGMFTALNGAKVYSLALEVSVSCANIAPEKIRNAGGLASYALVSLLDNVTVSTTLNLTSKDMFNVGGVFGSMDGTTVRNSAVVTSATIMSTPTSGSIIALGALTGIATNRSCTIFNTKADLTTSLNLKSVLHIGGFIGNSDTVLSVASCHSDSKFLGTSTQNVVGSGFLGLGQFSSPLSTFQNMHLRTFFNVTTIATPALEVKFGGLIGNFSGTVTSVINASIYSNFTAGADIVNFGGLVASGGIITVTNVSTAGLCNATADQLPFIAGLIGQMAQTASTITYCYTNIKIVAHSLVPLASYPVANIAGFICNTTTSSIITNCGATAVMNITADLNTLILQVGGFISSVRNLTTINSCYSVAAINISKTIASTYVGGFLGVATAAVMNNCYSQGQITMLSQLNASIGGFVGYLVSELPTSSMRTCYSNMVIRASVTGVGYMGGFLGYGSNVNVLAGCLSLGNLTAVSDTGFLSVGGFLGMNEASLLSANAFIQCGSSEVNISSQLTAAGGIVGGFAGRFNGTIQNCMATGIYTGTVSAGLFAGDAVGILTLINCIARYSEAGFTNVPFVKNPTLTTVLTLCYQDISLPGALVPVNLGVIGLTTLQMKLASSFSFVLSGIWGFNTSLTDGIIALIGVPSRLTGQLSYDIFRIIGNTWSDLNWVFGVAGSLTIPYGPYLKNIDYARVPVDQDPRTFISPIILGPGTCVGTGWTNNCANFACTSAGDCLQSATCTTGNCNCPAPYSGANCFYHSRITCAAYVNPLSYAEVCDCASNQYINASGVCFTNPLCGLTCGNGTCRETGCVCDIGAQVFSGICAFDLCGVINPNCTAVGGVCQAGICKCPDKRYYFDLTTFTCTLGCPNMTATSHGYCAGPGIYVCDAGWVNSTSGACTAYDCTLATGPLVCGIGGTCNTVTHKCDCNGTISVLVGDLCVAICLTLLTPSCVNTTCVQPGTGVVCSNAGLCVPVNSSYVCSCLDPHAAGAYCESCAPGYTYIASQSRCLINLCTPCTAGTCQQVINATGAYYQCTCAPGKVLYLGDCYTDQCTSCAGGTCFFNTPNLVVVCKCPTGQIVANGVCVTSGTAYSCTNCGQAAVAPTCQCPAGTDHTPGLYIRDTCSACLGGTCVPGTTGFVCRLANGTIATGNPCVELVTLSCPVISLLV